MMGNRTHALPSSDRVCQRCGNGHWGYACPLDFKHQRFDVIGISREQSRQVADELCGSALWHADHAWASETCVIRPQGCKCPHCARLALETSESPFELAATAAEFQGLEPLNDVERAYMRGRDDAARYIRNLAADLASEKASAPQVHINIGDADPLEKRFSSRDVEAMVALGIAARHKLLRARLDALEGACRQEHGGKYDEPECPICEALRTPTTTNGNEQST